MKRYWMVLLLLIILLAGCKSHFHEIRENRLFLYLRQSEARRVQLRCSVDGFKEHPATRVNDDLWEVSMPLPSEMEYFYIVDGEVFLPACQFKEKDDFGTENCIFVPNL